MPTPTARLGLLKPSTSDAFSTADIAANWAKIDQYPGNYVCTSTTRPSWGSAQQGMSISEADTGLVWRWTGTAFVRASPKGLLTTTGGGWARGQRTTTASTTSTTMVVAVSIDNVVVPAGNRTLMLTATWGQAMSTTGILGMYFMRSNVNNSGAYLAGWWQAGDSTSPSPGANGQGGSFITFEPGGLAAGTYNWSLQFRVNTTGTATIVASSTTPIEIAVIEI